MVSFRDDRRFKHSSDVTMIGVIFIWEHLNFKLQDNDSIFLIIWIILRMILT